MVEDRFGCVCNNYYARGSVTFGEIVQLSKKNNEKWNIIYVIIIDKGFSEYKVLKQEFPDAVLLYCHKIYIVYLFFWHVIKPCSNV